MISVLVADDSAVVRRLVSGVLNAAPDIQVVGTAYNGANAIERIDELHPDLVTLDIEMPVMDGIAAMREIRKRHPRMPVIMVSTLTQRGAAATLDALAAGASDYVTKPTNSLSLTESLGELSTQLLPRVRALGAPRLPARSRLFAAEAARTGATPAPMPTSLAGSSNAAPTAGRQPRLHSARAPQVLAIGSSTGGPDALSTVLGSLAERPRVPVVAVQHMPPVFTTMLAQRLDRLGPATVVEAEDGQRLEPGTVYLAPGGRHLEVARRGSSVVTVLHGKEPENYSRPSVDVLFRSVAVAYPGSAVGLILTGMGRDGREGCRAMGATGALIVAQDHASSVVWGMPGAVTEAGLADKVLALGVIGQFLSAELRSIDQSSAVTTGVVS